VYFGLALQLDSAVDEKFKKLLDADKFKAWMMKEKTYWEID
jgi:hypothetical protein